MPTLVGNAELGWNHFTGRHNIRKCDLVHIKIGVITACCKGMQKCPNWVNQ
ncbi:hypothetical protein [Streptomyces sp. NPDC015125]|uniref:hypothetical protein n=1 Tax=Streptomyces sp. NPDC015125 TaxID=3364938 RepID=UPI0036FC6F32